MPIYKGKVREDPREAIHFKTPYRLQSLDDDGIWKHYEWVHCPVCHARSFGFTPSGRPAYSGGYLILRVKKHPRGILVGCNCWLGERIARRFDCMRLSNCDPDGYEIVYPKPHQTVRVLDSHDQIVTQAPSAEPTELRPAYQGPEPDLGDSPPADLFGS